MVHFVGQNTHPILGSHTFLRPRRNRVAENWAIVRGEGLRIFVSYCMHGLVRVRAPMYPNEFDRRCWRTGGVKTTVDTKNPAWP